MRTLICAVFTVLAAVLPAGAAENTMTFDAAVAAMKGYTLGGDFTACQRVIDEINAAGTDAARQAAIAAKLAGALRGAGYDAQKFLCSQLYLVATEKEAPLLAPLLTDEKLSASALSALHRVPGKAVDRVLLEALGKHHGQAARGRGRHARRPRQPRACEGHRAAAEGARRRGGPFGGGGARQDRRTGRAGRAD